MWDWNNRRLTMLVFFFCWQDLLLCEEVLSSSIICSLQGTTFQSRNQRLILLHHSVSKLFVSINFIVEFILVCVKHGLAYPVVSSSTFFRKLMALSFSYCSSVQNGCFFSVFLFFWEKIFCGIFKIILKYFLFPLQLMSV